ncbi:HET-domain-containing protein [Cryphonectria parasitica EP155]|uniref:HET-domain-containing protein n=1 Tax=Cryphonectria parasitica (strain ATCC 38755 / EP155) TaxID=660469 RepID=A0A9P5CUH2_CRYP1|nr:HET-domain-containing protein [Cryphonectria parasitica EP155]KAF3771318.1 HET-domain-containing protein [Cryphonectria parasitica EP155]
MDMTISDKEISLATASALYSGVPLELNKTNSFRLLEVLPGGPGDPVAVHLLESDLSKGPKYEAVSYTWGDPSTKQVIQVERSWTSSNTDALQPATTSFEVTVNCYNAIRRLRSAAEKRVLWIDAICIDQRSTREKTHQLSIMAQIYSSASQVLVHLGEAADDSDAVMDWINELYEPSDYGQLSDSSSRYQPDNELIHKFLCRPWFHRIWVLQEIAHATSATVYCGSKESSWASLQNFKQWGISSAFRHSKDIRYGSFSQRLMGKLAETRHCQASDPRDKLFAILPLLDLETRVAAETENWRLKDPEQQQSDRNKLADKKILDYRLPVSKVFTELSLYLQENLGVASILAKAGGSYQLPGLPSWALSWEMGRQPRALTDTRHYMPQGRQEWTASWLEDDGLTSPTKLELRAARLGTICAVGIKCDIGEGIFPLAQWRRLVREHKPEYLTATFASQYTRRPWLSAFTLLLSHDNAVYDKPLMAEEGADFVEMEANPTVLGRRGGRRDKGLDMGQPAEKQSLIAKLRSIVASGGSPAQISKRMILACEGRSLVLTDTGLMGLAINDAKVGDVLYADLKLHRAFTFRRCETPRAVDPLSNNFTLVGDCYVHRASSADRFWPSDGDETEVRKLVRSWIDQEEKRYSREEDIVIW